ncbi:MAG: hypothetical protein PHW60_06560, partial [Kiritimatiellae bacterium]|nr:hypothetical protein [Kiritimatiellia bacterium]
TPVAEIFRFYRPAFPGEYVELTRDASEGASDGGSADALCLKTAGGVYLFIVNHSLAESAVTLPDIFAASTGEALVYEGRQNGVENFPRKDTIKGRNIVLPPMSVCRWHGAG